jgi:long-chain fatty acid transport protein
MSIHPISPTLQTTSLLCLILLNAQAGASGFRLPETSVAGTALSNAVVANPELPGALPYNPAAAAFQPQGQLVFGAVVVQPNISVEQGAGNVTKSQGDRNVLVPNVFASDHLNEQWSWGIGINAPFGLETRWPDETFAAFAGAADPLEPEHSKIEMLNINPNISYRLNKSTSIAVGLDNYRVRKLIFNTQAIAITGKGQSTGWNSSLLHVHDKWSLGLSYRSSVKVQLDGRIDASAIGSTVSNADASITFPSLLQVGARYKINDKFAVELDIERTGWSSFDVIEVNHSSPGLPNPISSVNNWKDASAYRLGGTYELSKTSQLRAGYAFDETPGNDAFFSARVPGNDRQTISVGLGHKMADWTLELAYMYVKADDRRIASITPFAGGDPNGTNAYNGTYGLSAHLFGVGVNTRF